MIRTIVPNFDVKFKNNHVVYETFIKCTVKDYEFNASYNSTLLSGSQGVMTPFSSSVSGSVVYITSQDNYGILKDFATGSISGSEFSPYVSTVGLYNDAQELLAVAKMAAPMPLSPDTDQTFLVKWDLNFTSQFQTPPPPCLYYTVDYSVSPSPPFPVTFTYIDCNNVSQSLTMNPAEVNSFYALSGSLDFAGQDYLFTVTTYP